MQLEKIIIEGISPEHALSKLQRSGISIYHAKKIKKNQILVSISKKDSEKVFAIYSNICYNISVYSARATPYTAKKVGLEGTAAWLSRAKKRSGVFLGALLFVALLLMSNRYVLKIEFLGTDVYRSEVLAVLKESGVQRYARYPKGKETEICAKILQLDDVSYCSVKKVGTVLSVEVRLSAFSAPSSIQGEMKAKHTGKVLQIAVLSGEPVKQAGDEVKVGETLVSVTQNFVIARVQIECVYSEWIESSTPESAFAVAYLSLDGEITAQTCRAENGGYRVTITYTVTETQNF